MGAGQSAEHTGVRPASSGRLSQAEGWLELITGPAAKLGLNRQLRRKVARRVLLLAYPLDLDESQRWRRDFVIGQALRLQGKYRLAIGPLRSVTQRNPDCITAWVLLGWCLKRAGQLRRAAAVLGAATIRIPDAPSLHYNLACYLSLLGREENSLLELQWALDLQPSLRKRLMDEKDFDPIRELPEFQALCQEAP